MPNLFRDAVAAYFTGRPGVWINALDLEVVGGRYAWRTRISECRTQLGMTIENQQHRHVGPNQITLTMYRYVPPTLSPAAETGTPRKDQTAAAPPRPGGDAVGPRLGVRTGARGV